MHPLLKEFVEHYENTYKECSGISKELVDERKAKTFGISFCIINCDSDIGFDKARQLYSAELKNTSDDFTLGGTHLMNQHLFIMSSNIFEFQITAILGSKNENLFLDSKYRDSSYKYIKKIPIETAFIVNDSPSSPLNTSKTFAEVNRLVDHQLEQRDKSFLLDYVKSKKRISQIEQEIIIDESNDDLNDI
jgi:hypothetical protein